MMYSPRTTLLIVLLVVLMVMGATAFILGSDLDSDTVQVVSIILASILFLPVFLIVIFGGKSRTPNPEKRKRSSDHYQSIDQFVNQLDDDEIDYLQEKLDHRKTKALVRDSLRPSKRKNDQ